MKQITTVSFDTTINGVAVFIAFTRTTVFGRENYGADADGNRGMMIDTIDVDDHSNILVSWEDDDNAHNDIPLVVCAAMKKAWSSDTIVETVENYMESHPPEPEEHDIAPDDEPDDYEPYWES